jgi:hypothetical protein
MAIRKRLGNVKIKLIPTGQIFRLAGMMKNPGNEAISKQKTKQNCLLNIGINLAIPKVFSRSTSFFRLLYKKYDRGVDKFSKPFAALLLIIPLLSRLILVRQFL